MERYYEIVKINWKHNLFLHFVIALLLCVAAPFLMGVNNLEEPQVAKIIEFYLSFLGVILLIPLFIPDTNKDIRDLIASKKTPITSVRICRILEAVICLSVILLLFLYFLKMGDCEFRYGTCFFVAMANCVFMGGIGLLIYSMIDNIALAYMIPILYFIVSMGSGKKYLGKFWLLGFSSGNSIGDKSYLLAAGVVMITAALLIRKVRRR
ncbi:MAG: hypothetical protein HFJ06_12235 [Lachnospiraceae bacterium]|nr:hypothetical protein [Lachnospiraceae bacterium]